MSKWVSVLVLIVATAAGAVAQQNIDLKGRFYRSVFMSGPDSLSSGDLAEVPEPLRGRLSRYLIRRSAFQTRYEGKPADLNAVASDAKKRVIERAIASLLDQQDSGRLAVAFVKDAPIAADWERRPGGPLAEATYAEGALKSDPDGPLAPYLYVFIADRQRAAFEAADRAKDVDVMKAAAKKYRTFIQRARNANDQLFRLLADDLERVPYVYMKTEVHPRDFNPDA